MVLPSICQSAAGPDQGRQARRLGAGALTLLLLGGCGWIGDGPATPPQALQQEQERARQQRLQRLVQDCRGGQAALRRLTAQLQANSTALEQLAERRYAPSARPRPPADAVLQRYTISDQELELERHQQALDAWRRRESWRRRSWLNEQAAARGRLEEQRRQLRLQLAELQPAAVGPAPALEPRTAVLAAYGSCNPEALAALDAPSSKASAPSGARQRSAAASGSQP